MGITSTLNRSDSIRCLFPFCRHARSGATTCRHNRQLLLAAVDAQQQPTYTQTAITERMGLLRHEFQRHGFDLGPERLTTSPAPNVSTTPARAERLLTPGASFPRLSEHVTGGRVAASGSEPIYEWLDTYAPGNWVDSTLVPSISPLRPRTRTTTSGATRLVDDGLHDV